MNWRIIVRYNLIGKVRRKLDLNAEIHKRLKACGVSNVESHSRSYEAKSVCPKEAVEKMKQVLDLLAAPKENGFDKELDNIMIYRNFVYSCG